MTEKSESTDVQSLVDQAMADAQASLDQVRQEAEVAVSPEDLSDIAETPAAPAPRPSLDKIDLLSDVDLEVMIELGRTQMRVEDVLRLAEGSVVELDKLAGDPVDVYVNQQLVARGEVLVLNDNFCIRISEILADLEEEAAAAQQRKLNGE